MARNVRALPIAGLIAAFGACGPSSNLTGQGGASPTGGTGGAFATGMGGTQAATGVGGAAGNGGEGGAAGSDAGTGGAAGMGGAAGTTAGSHAGAGGFAGAPSQYTVDVHLDGYGSGTVTSTPAGIDCGQTCSAVFEGPVVLTATPVQGTIFVGWISTQTSNCSGTGTCAVDVSTASGSPSLRVTVYAMFKYVGSPLGAAGAGGTAGTGGGAAGTGGAAARGGGGGAVGIGGIGGFAGFFGSRGGSGSPYDPVPYPVTVIRAGNGNATITSDPPGISCGATCSATFAGQVNLQATVASDSVLEGWSDPGCQGYAGAGGNPNPTGCGVKVDGPKTVTATISLKKYEVEVDVDGTGMGTVTSTPPGISCSGPKCRANFDVRSTVTLTATPAPGSTFAGWSWGCSGNQTTCSVTVVPPLNNTSPPVTVHAKFNPADPATLTVNRAGPLGWVGSSPGDISCGSVCSAPFVKGSTVTLFANGANGNHFEGWSGQGCTGLDACVVTMDADKSVNAIFGAGPLPLLRYRFDGDGTDSGYNQDHPMTFTGAVTFGAGKVGQAAQFASGGLGVVQGTRSQLGVYWQYTISFWINATSPPSSAAFFDSSNMTTAPYGGIEVGYSSENEYFLCAATSTNPNLGGSCKTFPAPGSGAWHSIIIRYQGMGPYPGQGAPVEVFEDGSLVATIANDAANDPVFNPGVPDTLSVGAPGLALDDLRIYDLAYPTAEEQACALITNGEWDGTACTVP